MRKQYWFWMSFFLASVVSCVPSESEQSSKAVDHSASSAYPIPPPSGIEVNLLSLSPEIKLDTVKVEITYDHSFSQAKTYLAIPFLPLLRQLVDKFGIESTHTEVLLVCKDGYIPSLELSQILRQGGGYLAFRDEDAPTGFDWAETVRTDYSPYYLVWENLPYEDHSMAWPFGLTALTFVPMDSSLNKIRPTNARQEVVQGFELYKENCLKCHSINRIGGIMGPEFNEPKNITTYWSREDIMAFVQEPTAYRYNSKMPAITHLSQEDLSYIIDYLSYLAQSP
ncbi:MAG: cytochrome c [Bacteroidota bacterium]